MRSPSACWAHLLAASGDLLKCVTYPMPGRLQPNTETRQKQLEAWRALILSYCRHQRLYTLDLAESLQSPLFYNADIKRERPRGFHM